MSVQPWPMYQSPAAHVRLLPVHPHLPRHLHTLTTCTSPQPTHLHLPRTAGHPHCVAQGDLAALRRTMMPTQSLVTALQGHSERSGNGPSEVLITRLTRTYLGDVQVWGGVGGCGEAWGGVGFSREVRVGGGRDCL